MIRVLILEHRPALQKGLRMLLAAEPGFSVIGEASDCEAGLDLATLLCPDVVVADAEMPSLVAIAPSEAFHLICRQAPVIVLSIYDDGRTRARALDAGAAAFVAKCLPADILLTTIRRLAHESESGPIVPAFEVN